MLWGAAPSGGCHRWGPGPVSAQLPDPLAFPEGIVLQRVKPSSPPHRARSGWNFSKGVDCILLPAGEWRRKAGKETGSWGGRMPGFSGAGRPSPGRQELRVNCALTSTWLTGSQLLLSGPEFLHQHQGILSQPSSWGPRRLSVFLQEYEGSLRRTGRKRPWARWPGPGPLLNALGLSVPARRQASATGPGCGWWVFGWDFEDSRKSRTRRNRSHPVQGSQAWLHF